jgi:hypothetical protein
MGKIITTAKLCEIKPMSQNNIPLINQLITETEEVKIRQLLGCEIYDAITAEISSNSISADLQHILDQGLYHCVTYMVYARYIQESMLVDTFTGMVTKVRPDSQVASNGAIKNIANEYTNMAMFYFNLVKDDIFAKYGYAGENNVKINNFSDITAVRRSINKNKGQKIYYM